MVTIKRIISILAIIIMITSGIPGFLAAAEGEATTEWNVLCLIFKNVDSMAKVNEKEFRHTDSLDEVDVSYLTNLVKKLGAYFSDISGGLMTVRNVDVYSVETPITKLRGWNNSLEIEDMKDVLDEYLAKGAYNQIILIYPVADVAVSWSGLGGIFYEDKGVAQISYKSRSDYPGDYCPQFPVALFVHEILHCIEARACSIKDIAELHAAEEYGYSGENEWIEWYRAYMRNQLPDGKGLPAEAYVVSSEGGYTVVPDQEQTNAIIMTIGDPYMSVNGQLAEIDPGRGTVPVIVDDRTMVPVRAIVETLGGSAAWDGNEQKALLEYNGNAVQMWLGKKEIIINGIEAEMDTVPFISNDRTLLPIRFVAENLGCDIEWIAEQRQVIVSY